MSPNLHSAAPKITTFDQHTNPFVFKCEMNMFRKIRVRKLNTKELLILNAFEMWLFLDNLGVAKKQIIVVCSENQFTFEHFVHVLSHE